MDPRDKLLSIIAMSFTIMIALSIIMILTGCAEPIQATGGVRV